MFPLHVPPDDALRKELEHLDDLTAALLSRRGIASREEADAFLNPSYDQHLHDPLLMTDMPKAARRLADAILAKEKIIIWSDYDCDGIPGGVLFHDFLKKVGANFANHIPHRHDDGYGVSASGIEKLAREGAQLFVTIDSGITDIEAVLRARELGVDVIITDHHLPKEVLPEAYAVINPNARADESYPFRGLCGAGVAWKLACATLAIEPVLRERVPVGWEKWLLDMVGLATIADMVPLVGENRVLARYGLLVMRKSPRIGLAHLCRVTRVNQRTITEDDVGFMLAPRVNAASRMGDAFDAFRLLTTVSEDEAAILAKKLDAANRKRKAEAGSITRAVHTRLGERTQLPSVIALGDPSWRPALLGLVANTIADEFERPVFLWGREGNNTIKGSMRSAGKVHGLELMEAAGDTFDQFGGHAAAGGFAVAAHALFDLEERLVTAYERIANKEDDTDVLLTRADAVVVAEEIAPAFLTRIETLAPFGIENPKPVFLLRDAVVRSVTRFGKSGEHLKIEIEGRRTPLSAVAFFAKGALSRDAEKIAAPYKAHLIGHLERDTFSRGQPVRIRLLALKSA